MFSKGRTPKNEPKILKPIFTLVGRNRICVPDHQGGLIGQVDLHRRHGRRRNRQRVAAVQLGLRCHRRTDDDDEEDDDAR